MAEVKQRSADRATQQMLALADKAGLRTTWDRLQAQEPLPWGLSGRGPAAGHATDHAGPLRRPERPAKREGIPLDRYWQFFMASSNSVMLLQWFW